MSVPNISYNLSMVPPLPTLPPLPQLDVTQVAINAVLLTASLSTNVAILTSLLRSRCGRRHSSSVFWLYVQLNLADLLVTLFCLLGNLVWAATVQWRGGALLCKFIKVMQVFSLNLSAFIITYLSIDRCVAVLRPLRRQKRESYRYAVIALWAVALLTGLPQAFIFRLQSGPWPPERFVQCHSFGAYSARWQEPVYQLFSFCSHYALPLSVMTLAHICLIVALSKKVGSPLRSESEQILHDPLTASESRRRRLYERARRRTSIVALLIVSNYMVCWTPYYVVFFLHTWLGIHVRPEVHNAVNFFSALNSTINPLIYGAPWAKAAAAASKPAQGFPMSSCSVGSTVKLTLNTDAPSSINVMSSTTTYNSCRFSLIERPSSKPSLKVVF